MGKVYNHLSWNDRLIIERMLLQKFKVDDIAKAVGCCRATIYNEIKRSRYTHTNSDLTEEERYNPEGAQQRYDNNMAAKGASIKALGDKAWFSFMEEKIRDEKKSPEAALYEIQRTGKKFDTEIMAVGTVYSYIKKGLFEGLTLEDLPVKPKKGKSKKKVQRQKNPSKGTSIEKRPEKVLKREEFGHWEMDTVIGKSENKKNLLVLTERKTRKEMIELLKNHTAIEVVRAINRIEKRFGSRFYMLFKTITVDNGSEFLDYNGIEKALYRVGKRTTVFFCHPYRSCERGSNENQNRFIRRWYPKGSDFDKLLKKKDIKFVEEWINNYPRRMFNGRSSEDLFKEECSKAGIQL